MSDIDYRLGDWAQNKSFASALAAAGGGVALIANPQESWVSFNDGAVVINPGEDTLFQLPTTGGWDGPDLEASTDPYRVKIKTSGVYLARLWLQVSYAHTGTPLVAKDMLGFVQAELDLHNSSDYTPQLSWAHSAEVAGVTAHSQITLFLPAGTELSASCMSQARTASFDTGVITNTVHQLYLSLLRFL